MLAENSAENSAEVEIQGFMVILMWPGLPHSVVAGISKGEK